MNRHFPEPGSHLTAQPVFEQQSAPQIAGLIDLDYLFAAARRQFRLVLFFMALGLVLGVVYLANAIPAYTSSATILIDKRQLSAVDRLAQSSGLFKDDAEMMSEVEILRSGKIANMVVDRLNLDEDEAFLAQNSNPFRRLVSLAITTVRTTLLGEPAVEEAARNREIALAILDDNREVRRVGTTYVLEVAYTDTDPARAATIATGFAEAYLQDQIESKLDASRRASEWMVGRIEQIRGQHLQAERAVAEYKAANDLIDVNGRLVSEQQQGELATQLTTRRSETNEARANFEQIQAVLQADDPTATVAAAIGDETIRELRRLYLQVQKEADELTARLGPDHAQVRDRRDQMASYEQQIRGELQRLAEAYRNTLDVRLSRERAAEEALLSAVRQNAEANSTLIELRELEREAASYRAVYETILNQYQSSVTNEDFPVGEARVITAATPSKRPSQPVRSMVLGLSAALGLLAGAGLGFLREYNDRFFRSAEQVRDETGLPFLGYVPMIADGGRVAAKRPIGPLTLHPFSRRMRYATEHPLSIFAETLRATRVSLELRFGGQPGGKVVGVVSALPSEGKSTVAANLARILASGSPNRVLLIDGDLRDPGLSRAIAPHARLGLAELLTGKASMPEVVMTGDLPNLDVVPAASTQLQFESAALLGSARMADLLRALAARYDYVVLDLPPILPVVDVKAVAGYVDAFAVVVRWGGTSRLLVRNALGEDPRLTEKALGVILNQTDVDMLKLYSPAAGPDYRTGRYYGSYISDKKVRAPDAEKTG